MATLRLTDQLNRQIPVLEGQTLLHALQSEYLDWMHLCGGKGGCITCRIQIKQGQDALSAMTKAEVRFSERGWLKDHERLTCQVKVVDPTAEIVGRTPEETRLPHINYSEG